MENDIQKKVPAHKIADKTLTPKKNNEIQNFEPKTIARAPVAGKSQSNPLGSWGEQANKGIYLMGVREQRS